MLTGLLLTSIMYLNTGLNQFCSDLVLGLPYDGLGYRNQQTLIENQKAMDGAINNMLKTFKPWKKQRCEPISNDLRTETYYGFYYKCYEKDYNFQGVLCLDYKSKDKRGKYKRDFMRVRTGIQTFRK